MNTEKLVSIIIPCYNVENYIVTCLESCLSQGLDFASYEIIVVNDGSEDNTLTYVKNFQSQHPQLQMRIFSQENAGLSTSRNNGLSYAEGKYILYLDSDDSYIHYTLPKIIDKAEENHLDMLWFDHQLVDEKDNVLPLPKADCKKHASTDIFSGPDFIKRVFNHSCMVWHFMFRKDFLTENNILFAEGIIFEDIVYTLQCLYRSRRVQYYPVCVYKYLIRSTSIMRSESKKRKRSLDAMYVAAQLNDTFKDTNDNDLRRWVYDFMNGIVQFNLRRMVKSNDDEGYRLCLGRLKDFNLLPLPMSFFLKQNCLTRILNISPALYKKIVRLLP